MQTKPFDYLEALADMVERKIISKKLGVEIYNKIRRKTGLMYQEAIEAHQLKEVIYNSFMKNRFDRKAYDKVGTIIKI